MNRNVTILVVACCFCISCGKQLDQPKPIQEARMEFPQDATGDVLRRMQADGFNFESEHPIEFFAVFPTEAAADTVAKQYLAEHKAGDKLANIETQPAESGEMELILAKHMLATYENISAFETQLAERAAAAGGHDDGWGVMQE